MKHLEKLTRKRLGDILIDEGLISKEQLVDAEREHKRSGDPLGSIIVEASYLTDWDLAKIVATQYQLPFVELHSIGINSDLEGMFNLEEQVKRRFIPIDNLGKTLTLAVVDMPDIEFLRSVQERTGRTPFLFVALLSDIRKVLIEAGATFEEMLAAPATPVAESTVHEIDPQDLGIPISAKRQPGNEDESDVDVSAIIGDALSGGEWENLFDSANESVLKEIDRE